MKCSTLLIASLGAGLLLSSAACAPAKPPEVLERGLESADPETRRSSADDLREDGHVPSDAVPKLWAAIKQEHDADAFTAMLITLAATGDADVKPWACGNVGGEGITDASRLSHARSRALTVWLQKNPGQGGCSMSDIQEVPVNQGPQATKPKPIAPKANIFSPGM